MKRATIAILIVAFLLPGNPSYGQLTFRHVSSTLVDQRLKMYQGTDSERQATLQKIFQDAGCSGSALAEQQVPHLKQQNVVCTLPGDVPDQIVVGAHFDHVDKGDGVVDNWSGASLLPSFFQAMLGRKRHYTFVFIGFAGEERGLVGSKYYAKMLNPEEKKKIVAMVNLDTLGLGPTAIRVTHSDQKLVNAMGYVERAMNAKVLETDIADGVGQSDEESFRRYNIPTITIHTLTQQTLPILHTWQDRIEKIDFAEYYKTYSVVSAYLVVLDTYLP